MKKQITTIALGILMIAGAMAMYSGDNMTFETNLTNPVYTVNENSSNIDGLNITFDNGIVTISPVLNYKPDNFTLIFFDNVTREIEKIIYRGGGGGRTRYVDNNITVYVPEYINHTEEVEVDKIITETIIQYQDTGLKLWNLILGIILGGLFGAWVYSDCRKEENK